MQIEQIAQVCHAVNRAYCQAIGDDSQVPWEEAANWQQESAVRGVRFALANPSSPISAQHEAWLADKQADGWIWGPFKDSARKEHPAMVPYAELPQEQRVKDYLFRAVVSSLSGVLV